MASCQSTCGTDRSERLSVRGPQSERRQKCQVRLRERGVLERRARGVESRVSSVERQCTDYGFAWSWTIKAEETPVAVESNARK